MNYKVGQLLTLGKEDTKYELLSYLGEWRRKSDGVRVVSVKPSAVLEDGRDHVYYEVWECLNLNTGFVETKKVPIYVFLDLPEEYVNSDRKEVIYDGNEVTSLLDHYSCWYTGNRDRMNFHLDIVQDRHIEQIHKLRDLDSQVQDTNYAVGIRLKLMMKENPNLVIRIRFKEWKQQFPNLFTKLQKDVYNMQSSNENVISVGINSNPI